jgi:hypothetical protein
VRGVKVNFPFYLMSGFLIIQENQGLQGQQGMSGNPNIFSGIWIFK